MDFEEKLKLLQENRDKILDHVSKLEEEMDSLPKIDPGSINARNSHLLENRLRVRNDYYNLILRYRDFIQKSVIDEVKLSTNDKDKEIADSTMLNTLLNAVIRQTSINDIKIPDIEVKRSVNLD